MINFGPHLEKTIFWIFLFWDKMCSMCHNCVELSKLEEKKRQETGNSLNLDIGGPIWPCKFCGKKQEGESVKRDIASPYTTPMMSPTTSLSSSDSFVSSSSKFLSNYFFDIFS